MCSRTEDARGPGRAAPATMTVFTAFTRAVREELAGAGLPAQACCRRAEAAALLRVGGVCELAGGVGVQVAVTTTVNRVARRVLRLVRSLSAAQADVEVHEQGGLHTEVRYRVVVRPAGPPDDAAGLLGHLGLLDDAGRPVAAHPPPALVAQTCDVRAYLRGAVQAAGRFAAPGQPAHAEIGAPNAATARRIEQLCARVGVAGFRAGAHGQGWRVVGKSGEQLGRLLVVLDAHTAFLSWDQGRLRSELRADANRAANADRANVQRAVSAAGRDRAAIGRLVDALGWEGVPEALRAVALVRVVNPEASLAELGALLEPPLDKVAVHRRLRRLTDLAGEMDDPGGEPPGTRC